ncbi:MAG: hypothetical protein K2O32_03960 [Acetatifactor sp.]|nr:hypothetical protein [Acetatifactor sp.]
MIVKWIPQWCKINQFIVVGDVDLFYLSKDNLYFSSGGLGNDDYEVKAKILKITHPKFGDIRGIIMIGLGYQIYLSNGDMMIGNFPGDIESLEDIVNEWKFDVHINIIEKTGLTFIERFNMLNHLDHNEIKAREQERFKRYIALLDLTKPN